MRKRVEREPSLARGGIVAQFVGGPRVAELVEGESGEDRGHEGREVNEEDNGVFGETVQIPDH